MTNLASARRQVRVGKGELKLFGRAPRRRRGVHPAAAVPGPVEGGRLGGGVPGTRSLDEFNVLHDEILQFSRTIVQKNMLLIGIIPENIVYINLEGTILNYCPTLARGVKPAENLHFYS